MRRNITKLRVSSHRLEIEVGRYSKKGKKERVIEEKRLCKHCNLGHVEDEEHVIMSCPKYDLARKDMLDNLLETFPHMEQANNHSKFIFIMQCHDYEATDALSKMLMYVHKERGSI